MAADFAAADANADGVLDLAEFTAFQTAQIAKFEERGHFMGERGQKIPLIYSLFDEFNTETQGVSYADYLAMMGVWMMKFMTLKAQAAAAQ